MNTLPVVVFLSIVCVTNAFVQQAVHVKGRFLCGSTPIDGMQVKLMDEDNGPDPDDQLDATRTNRQGEFELKGSTLEVTDIDPEIKIYTDCNDDVDVNRFLSTGVGKPCQRKIVLKVPRNFITINSATAEPSKVLDIGVFNLEMGFPDEERDCIH